MLSIPSCPMCVRLCTYAYVTQIMHTLHHTKKPTDICCLANRITTQTFMYAHVVCVYYACRKCVYVYAIVSWHNYVTYILFVGTWQCSHDQLNLCLCTWVYQWCVYVFMIYLCMWFICHSHSVCVLYMYSCMRVYIMYMYIYVCVTLYGLWLRSHMRVCMCACGVSV
jgi:hypothetical protein